MSDVMPGVRRRVGREAKPLPGATKYKPGQRREVTHDEAPSQITDHKYSPMGEWYTRCRICKLAEAAHAESELHYYSDDM